jgi:poly(3-hydroxybutyrate) depolymerase
MSLQETKMRAIAPILLSLLALSAASPVAAAEVYVEGFARALSASNQGLYASDRGIKVASSWEYARDGKQRIEWETAPVPDDASEEVVVFVWSSSLDASSGPHELSLNGEKILEFVSGGFSELHTWSAGPYSLEFEPLLGYPRFEMHGIMRLRVPLSAVEPGKPATLAVRGLAEGGGAWFMLHHFTDVHTFARTGTITLPSGHRLPFAPLGSLFKAPHRIAWTGSFLLSPAADSAETFRLRARLLQEDGEEKNLVREIHTQTDQREVEIDLWSTREVSEGTHSLELVAEDEEGKQLAAWQGKIAVHHLAEFRQRKERAERLAAKLEADESVPSPLRQLSLPGVSYRLVQAQRQIDALLDTSQFSTGYAEALQTVDETLAQLQQIDAGADPYAGATGYVDRAYRSELDGTLQPYFTYVPTNFDPQKIYPLVVVLHGFGGGSRGAINNLLGMGDQPSPDCQYIVVAPSNRSNIGYTNRIGEDDIWRTIADVKSLYPIDDNRIYLTGMSMGGGGTWHLGLRHPDRFAAIVPICGSTDWRLWAGDSPPSQLRQQVLDADNPLSFAENAACLPILAAHGEADPVVTVEHSRRMVTRLQELDCSVKYEEYPGVGHVSWNNTYADGRILEWFGQHVRDPRPRRIAYVTTDPGRYGQNYWIRIEALIQPYIPGRIAARVEATNLIVVETENLARFTLTPADAPVYLSREISIRIDGTERFRDLLPLGESISFRREGTRFVQTTEEWSPEPIPYNGQEAARSGWHIYTYGTQGTAEENAAMRQTAERLAAPNQNVDILFPVKADTAITERDIASADLILLGTPATNRLLGRIHSWLPIHFRADGVAIGDRLFAEENQLLVLIHPNPLNPDRYIQILGGTTPASFDAVFKMTPGTPDYAILRPDGSSVTEGLFDIDWKLRRP